jgi:hypothetical protein
VLKREMDAVIRAQRQEIEQQELLIDWLLQRVEQPVEADCEELEARDGDAGKIGD